MSNKYLICAGLAILISGNDANAQQVVDNSIIGTRYQTGLIEVLAKYVEDPRSVQLKGVFNGTKQGVLCGQISYRDKSGSMTPFNVFVADTTYIKLTLLDATNGGLVKSMCFPG